MSTLLSIHHRLISRAIELKYQKPALLLEAVDFCVANPIGTLPPALQDAINTGEHFFPPEKTMETMRMIIASNKPQQDIFSKVCFNASSSWRAKGRTQDNHSPQFPDAVGKWKLLGTEVQTSLLFFALHQRVQISLLQAVMRAVPHSLHVLPEAIFVQVYCGMRNTSPKLIDAGMQQRADDILAAQRISMSDLVRLSLARHPGAASLRALWMKISDRNIFPPDAFCFLHEGLEQPEVYLTPADNPMINRIYDLLHRRPDLLAESIYSFVHVYARNPAASTQWQHEVDTDPEQTPIRCFLEDLIRGKLKIDLKKLKLVQLAWYIRFSCENATIQETELHALLHLIQTDGFRSTLVPSTESNRKSFTSFFMQKITLNLLTAVRSLSFIGQYVPKFLCALMESSLVELNYYYDKIATGELKYIGAGKVASALPLTKEIQREMERMAKQVENSEISDSDPTERSNQKGECIFIDVQWRIMSQLRQILTMLCKTRQTALLTNEVEKAALSVMSKFIPRCPAELKRIFLLARAFAISGNLHPLLCLKRLYRFSFSTTGKGANKKIHIQHTLYVHEEREKTLVLTPSSSATEIKKCGIFLHCRSGVLVNMCNALLKSLPPIPKVQTSTRLIEDTALDAIHQVVGELHEFSRLLSVSSDVVLAKDKGYWIQMSHLLASKFCFRFLKYLLFLTNRHPQAKQMTPENMKIVETGDSTQIKIAAHALRKMKFTKQLLADIQAEDIMDEDGTFEENTENTSTGNDNTSEALEESIDHTEADTGVFTARFLLKQAEKLGGSSNDPNRKLLETLFYVNEVMTSITALSQGKFPVENCFADRCDLKAAHLEVLLLLLEVYPEKYAVPFQKVNEELAQLLCTYTAHKN